MKTRYRNLYRNLNFCPKSTCYLQLHPLWLLPRRCFIKRHDGMWSSRIGWLVFVFVARHCSNWNSNAQFASLKINTDDWIEGTCQLFPGTQPLNNGGEKVITKTFRIRQRSLRETPASNCVLQNLRGDPGNWIIMGQGRFADEIQPTENYL